MKPDALYAVQWRFVRQAAMTWIDRLDKIAHKAPAQVVMSLAITFLLVCKRFDLWPPDVLVTADRVIKRCRAVDPQYIRALDQYFKEELPDS